ncbi:MAG: hypothetical protein JW913_11175 [Chitinispirillaceae bacterium]|nr:hypothetical protein [Chitinispirillaceae bacterium]
MKRIGLIIVQASKASAAFVANAVKETRDIEIAGTAPDFRSGLDAIRLYAPDIVLVQAGPRIEEFCDAVTREYPETGIIILVVGNDPDSARYVVAALACGAIDYLAVSDKSDSTHNLLLSKIRCYSIKRYSHRARRNEVEKNHEYRFVATAPASGGEYPPATVPKFDAVLIGVSTGGPVALMDLLPGIPATFPVPLIIVLHMPKEFTGPMAAALDRKSSLHIKEAEDNEEPVRGKAYLAPGGFHCMLHGETRGKIRMRIADGPLENGCKPAADVLFRSAAPLLGNRALAVVLTGMGSDGTKGAKTVKRHGGFLVAQDEKTSIVWGMPGSIVRAGLADEVLPLDRIAARLCELIGI